MVGPPGHVEVIRAPVSDSVLARQDSAGLIALLTWSSDSLARTSRPSGAIVYITQPEIEFYRTEMADSLGKVVMVLPATTPRYHLRFVLIGVEPLDTTVAVRVGFLDTLRVFLQLGGGTICA